MASQSGSSSPRSAAHFHHQPLSAHEQTFVLARRWPNLHLDDPEDFTTTEARAAIIRITNGNFRLTTRLMAQIHRIMEISQLSTVTSEVMDAARESLVIGSPQPDTTSPHLTVIFRAMWR